MSSYQPKSSWFRDKAKSQTDKTHNTSKVKQESDSGASYITNGDGGGGGGGGYQYQNDEMPSLQDASDAEVFTTNDLNMFDSNGEESLSWIRMRNGIDQQLRRDKGASNHGSRSNVKVEVNKYRRDAPPPPPPRDPREFLHSEFEDFMESIETNQLKRVARKYQQQMEELEEEKRANPTDEQKRLGAYVSMLRGIYWSTVKSGRYSNSSYTRSNRFLRDTFGYSYDAEGSGNGGKRSKAARRRRHRARNLSDVEGRVQAGGQRRRQRKRDKNPVGDQHRYIRLQHESSGEGSEEDDYSDDNEHEEDNNPDDLKRESQDQKPQVYPFARPAASAPATTAALSAVGSGIHVVDPRPEHIRRKYPLSMAYILHHLPLYFGQAAAFLRTTLDRLSIIFGVSERILLFTPRVSEHVMMYAALLGDYQAVVTGRRKVAYGAVNPIELVLKLEDIAVQLEQLNLLWQGDMDDGKVIDLTQDD